MKRTPRRKRAHLKAWVYLALFGPDDEDDAGGADGDASAVPGTDRDDSPNDRPPREE